MTASRVQAARVLPASMTADRGLVGVVTLLCTLVVLIATAASAWLRISAADLVERRFEGALWPARQLQVTYTGVVDPRIPPDAAATVERSVPPSLRALLDAPRHTVSTTSAVPRALPSVRTTGDSAYLSVVGFQDARPLLDIVEGRFPRRGATIELLPPEVARSYDGPRRAPIVEVALERSSAEALDMRPGTYLDLIALGYSSDGPQRQSLLRVSGIYEPAVPYPSPLDDVDNARAPSISTLPEANLVRAAAVAADDRTVLGSYWASPPEVRWTFDPAGTPSVEEAEAVVDDARRLAVQPWPPVLESQASAAATSIGDLAATFVDERDTSDTLSALVLATLASAGASVLLGAASVLGTRRREVTDVLRARGASTTRLALTRAGEAVLMVVPGLCVAGLLVVWSPVTRGDLVPAAFVAAACVVLLAVVQVAPPRELSGRWGLALRDASQIVVVVLAVLVVAVMLGRDRVHATDPLVLMLPAVVSVAAGVVAVRAAQWLMTPLRRVAAAGSEQVAPVVGVSGAAAAAPRVMLPVVAVVLAGAGALLAQAVDDTLHRGAGLAGWQSVGADVAVSGSLLDEPLARRIEQLPGVASVAALRTAVGSVDTRVGARQVTVVAVDAGALEEVVRDSPRPLDVPLSDDSGGLTALVSEDLDLADAETTLTYAQASVPLSVAGRLDRVPGLPTVEPFVLVERQPFEAASDRTLERYETLLVSGTPESQAVAAAAIEVSPDAAVSTRTEVAAEALDGQVVRRIRVVVAAAAIASAVLALFAAALAIELGRPLRRRTAALLGALGAGRGAARWVSAFELLPAMAAAGLMSVGCGMVLMAVSDRTIDVGGLTGAMERAPVGLDPLSWVVAALLLGALVLGVAVASAWRGVRRYGRGQSDEMDMG